MIHSRIILFFITPFVFLRLLSAQEIKIEQIIDANLFLTEDSILVSMANLNVPSLDDPDSVRQQLAKKIIAYAELHLKGYSCLFIPAANKNCMDQQVSKTGHIYRKYPLSNLNMNAQYLEKGYAVYLPCDTLFMQDYTSASHVAIESRLGIWQPLKASYVPDHFNRFRLTNWLLQIEYDIENYFPIFGMNFRWSKIFSFFSNETFSFNLSGEAGTLIYFMLPYGNIGTELRYRKFYIRGNYNALLPFVWVAAEEKIEAYDFWGADIGFQIPLSKSAGIEIEYNLKWMDFKPIRIMSISFSTY